MTLVESLQKKSGVFSTTKHGSQQLYNCCSYKHLQLKQSWLFNTVAETYTLF